MDRKSIPIRTRKIILFIIDYYKINPEKVANKTIRIGTRDSELALWQAHTVQKKLQDLGYTTEIIAVKSDGDIILD